MNGSSNWFALAIGSRGCRSLLLAAVLFGGASPTSAQDDLISLIVELLGDKDKDVRALAFEQMRTQAPGEEATRKFAALLPTLPPETQVGLVSALAARRDSAAAPALRSLLSDSQDEAVRVAVIDALGYLGAEADAAPLAKLLAASSDAEQQAARASLVRLPGEPASKAIVAAMLQAPEAQRVALIEILTERRAGAVELLDAAVSDDPQVRAAAMNALGQFASAEHLPKLLRGVLKAERGDERAAAERAVAAVCLRQADPEQRGTALVAAYEALDPDERLVLLPTLGRVGGAEALKVAEAAFSDSDPKLHAAGLAALCNWPDGSIAPRLLELARTEEHADHRTQARKALIRIAPLADERSDERRLDLLRTTLAMCSDDRERNLVLDRAKAIRTIETLRFVVPLLDDEEFVQQACLTVVELAHHNKLRVPHKDEFHRALDRVIELSKDPVVVDRAQRYQQGKTWVRPKE